MKANGSQTVAWRRDDVNVFEFHVDVPQGVSTLDVAIDFISPPETGGIFVRRFDCLTAHIPELGISFCSTRKELN